MLHVTETLLEGQVIPIICFSRATTFMQSEQLRVAYLGPQGTYTHQVKLLCFSFLRGPNSYLQAAAAKFRDSHVSFVPFDTITSTFESVCRDLADFACIPLENSLHGSVTETLDLLRVERPPEHAVSIGGEFTMGIEHCLVVCRGVAMGDIKRVLSHEQVCYTLFHALELNT